MLGGDGVFGFKGGWFFDVYEAPGRVSIILGWIGVVDFLEC